MALRFPSRPTVLAICCTLSISAHSADDALDLGTVAVTAQKIEENTSLPPEYAGGQVARGAQLGVLGNKDAMDVPFTLTSYTAKLIEDQQAEDVGDVLLNDSSVRQAYGYGNNSQLFVIRGLTLSGDDISYNGLYGVLPRQILSTDALERVEVFKGPNSFLNGVSPTGSGLGGAVNLVSKRAGDTPLRRYTQDITSDGRIGEHLDLGQRFGEDNRFGARVNLSQREGETAVDDQDQRSKLFVAGLDYRGDRFRVSTDFGYQKQRIDHTRNSVRPGSATSIPSAPNSDHNYGQPWSYTETEDSFGMLRGDYDLNDTWTAYLAGGYKHTHETGVYGTPVLSNNSGDATIGGSHIDHVEDNSSFVGGLNGTFQTGPVSHQVSIGAATIWTQQRNAYVFYSSSNTNIYNTPGFQLPTTTTYIGGELDDPQVTGKTRNRSVAIADTLRLFDDHLLITAGIRRQQLRVESYDVGGSGRNAEGGLYDEGVTTPVYGLVFKPWNHVAFYTNRIEGLAQGPTPAATAENHSDTFSPGRTKQLEAGIKFDWETYGATFGVFRIDKPSDGYVNANNIFVASGNQVNKGIELNLFGEPVDGLRLMAGATRIDTKMEDTGDANTEGNHALGVPTFQMNASVDWDVPGLDGVALNARVLRTGGQYANAENTLTLPTWNRFDAGARYKLKVDRKDVTLRVNVENITDKNYWASAYGGYLTQGEPRLVKFSGTVDF